MMDQILNFFAVKALSIESDQSVCGKCTSVRTFKKTWLL